VKIPAAGILLVACATLPGQSAQVRWWSGTWDGAFAEAQTRNAPLLVVFIQDGEEANERLAATVLKDPAYVKATLKTVPILANRESHGSTKSEVGGVVKSVCAKFGGTTCEAHQNLETPARVELCGAEVQTPQHVLVLPDKKVVARIVDIAPVSAYQELVARGIKKLGKGLTNDDLKLARDRVREAGIRIEARDWGAAVKLLGEASAIVKDTPFAKDVDAMTATIDAAGRKELEKATAAEKAGDALVALRTLEEAAAAFAGLECVAALRKEMTRIKGTKAGVEAGRVLAREKRGQPSFEAAQAAEKAKDFLKAKREYERAATAAADTPLAEKARARLVVLAKDPDIKALFDRDDRETQARDLLKEAEKLVAAGMKDAALQMFERIVKEHPGTPAADKAKARLGELR
jgi:tetratricopeptide (TPR) repeat protein